MNKATKGAIAAGAAAVLLLGGLRSFALWNDSEAVTGGTINSGVLTIDAVGTGVWTDTSDDLAADVVIGADPSGYLIVPGDTLTYTANYTITSTGENLRASLSTDISDIGGSAELIAALDVTPTVTSGATVIGTDGAAVEIDVTQPSQTVSVAIDFYFDRETAGLIAQGDTVTLNNFNLTLQQVRPV